MGATRRQVLMGGGAAIGLAAALGLARRPAAADPAPAGFDAALAQARGQTVYFNAWAGDQRINDYIAWAGGELAKRHGVGLQHVKLANTAEAVTRVLADKDAGKADGGSVDLIWINGENFAAMKRQQLLFGPFAPLLPNMRLVDTQAKPTTLVDFTVPTDGLESPWGMAQFTFFYDSARVETPPRSMALLLAWSAANPGRFTYPAPPDFIGTSFLKQALLDLTPDPAPLQREASDVDRATAGLWHFLEQLHPFLWRAGKTFPKSGTDQRQLLDDGEVDFYMAYNPGDASSAIAQKLLPDTVRGFVPEGGSLANTHFLAIPFNAAAKAGAMVAADFLLSPEAQARKQNPDFWGDPTVLNVAALSPSDQAFFAGLPLGAATPTPAEMGRALPEPHPSWVKVLEDGWMQRFAG